MLTEKMVNLRLKSKEIVKDRSGLDEHTSMSKEEGKISTSIPPAEGMENERKQTIGYWVMHLTTRKIFIAPEEVAEWGLKEFIKDIAFGKREGSVRFH